LVSGKIGYEKSVLICRLRASGLAVPADVNRHHDAALSRIHPVRVCCGQ
jgi:hypothetical protein